MNLQSRQLMLMFDLPSLTIILTVNAVHCISLSIELTPNGLAVILGIVLELILVSNRHQAPGTRSRGA